MTELGSIAEGYYACRAVREIAEREGMNLPIIFAAYDVLYHSVSVQEAFEGLMNMRKMDELGRGIGWFLD